MSSNIIFNKKNIVGTGNNTLTYTFPRGSVAFTEEDRIGISHLNLYFSWFNISGGEYNNNKFSYTWWDASGNLTDNRQFVIPDGFYSVATLNEYFQTVMKDNGHYLETIDGQSYAYFIEFFINSTYYSSEVRLNSLSTQVDFGNGNELYTNIFKPPTGWTPPDIYETPQLIIPANSKFGELLGFTPQTLYQDLTVQPSSNAIYSFLNDITPNMLPASSYVITCSICENDLSYPDNIIHSFTIPPNTGFGDLISSDNEIVYSKIKQGTYQSITLKIYDTELRPLQILDPNMLITMSVIRK
jgi:hypothetical protein